MFFAFNLIFYCAFTSIGSTLIGIIKNASLSTNCSYVIMNASTCNECSCTMLYLSQNVSILSLNCYSNSSSGVSCELFTGTTYPNSCSYQMENSSNSIFYFQSLPPIDETVTTAPVQNFTTRWNPIGITIAGNAAATVGVNASLLWGPYGLALDSSNAVYIADYSNNRIQKWVVGASYGVTVAGLENGTAGASSVALTKPVGIVLDSHNNMYFTDRDNHRVMYWANGASNRSVIAGITSTIVAGGNGPGTSPTQLYGPYDFALDSVTNSLIIVNYNAHTIVRWVLGATSWTLLAGVSGTNGNTSTLLYNPLSIALDPYDNMYVCDSSNHRIQFFLAGQSNATTIAGITDSPGTNATQLYFPYWVILDSQMNLYVTDTYNNRVQKFFRY